MLIGICFMLSSCDDDDAIIPIAEGVNITVRNTLEETGTPESVYAALFGLSEDALDITAPLSNSALEFPNTLAVDLSAGGGPVVNGLYDIDFTENSIEFTLLPVDGDPFWDSNFRVLEAGTFDRYYFTLSSAHEISNFESSDSSVNLRIDSDQVIVVEIGEGFNFNPGAAFSITLE